MDDAEQSARTFYRNIFIVNFNASASQNNNTRATDWSNSKTNNFILKSLSPCLSPSSYTAESYSWSFLWAFREGKCEDISSNAKDKWKCSRLRRFWTKLCLKQYHTISSNGRTMLMIGIPGNLFTDLNPSRNICSFGSSTKNRRLNED